MSVDAVLDQMAAVHFREWVHHMRQIILADTGAVPEHLTVDVSYSQLPESERKMRRELMRQVLTVVVASMYDEVLLDAANAGDIAIDQAGELSQRLTDWLD